MPLFALLLLALLLPEMALAAPRHSPVPGGVAVVPLDETGEKAPRARWGERPLAVIREGGKWLALVGIPLDTPPGPFFISIGERRQVLTVRPKDYPVQRLTVANPRHVNPSPEDEARIEREQEIIDQAKSHYSASAPATDFVLPARGRLSSRFGLQRFFNGEARKPHAGLDLAVGTGSPILAPAPGTVINQGNYFFNGNTVFLDHGQGLISAYMHLSRVEVKEAGTLLGAAGATGRATGPHLHWAVLLNNTPVDPELFLKRP